MEKSRIRNWVGLDIYTVDAESIDWSLFVDNFFPVRYNPQIFFANSPSISDELGEISSFSDKNFLSEARRYEVNSPSFSWTVLSKNKNK